MKFFQKKRLSNGRKHIYFLGIKVFSYGSKNIVNKTLSIKDFALICSDDKLNLLLTNVFFERTGKLPCEKLETFTEKIIWSQMFDSTPEKEILSDKYGVREYVEKNIGKNYLIPLLAVWNDVSEVNFSNLPDKFVVKFSEGSGKNFIVKSKENLNLEHVKKIIRTWQSNYFWTQSFEMQYKNNLRKIIVEQFINTKIEYKLWVFNQKCKFIKIEIMQDFAENGKPSKQYGKYFYPDWTPADFKTIGTEPDFDIPKPKELENIIKNAEKLSKNFDFVRVDFFEDTDGNIKFGEMTFSPAAGDIHFVPENKNFEFGQILKLSSKE